MTLSQILAQPAKPYSWDVVASDTGVRYRIAAGQPGSNAVIAVNGPSVQAALAEDAFGAREAMQLPSIWNGQHYIASKLMTYGLGGGGSGSSPIRILIYGDSYTTGITAPSNMAIKGDLNLGRVSATTVGDVTTSVTDFATWVNGVTHTHAAGSRAEYTYGSQTGGVQQGNKACIGFIKGPTYGSFDLEYESSLSPGTWTPMGASAGKVFTVGGSNLLTSTAHGFVTGTPLRITAGTTMPTGLTAGVTYFAILVDANSFRLATTAALATAGTATSVSGGAGTLTATNYASIGISATNATTVGAYQEFDLPTSNAPFFKLRITNVTTGGFKRIFAGIFCTDGGGGILTHGILSPQGPGFSPNQYTVNPAIFDPIWAGLAPDLVLACFREDDGTQWDVGGAFDNVYLRGKTVRDATDWTLMGMHPSEDESFYLAVTLKQRQWAVRNKESWFNPYPLFRDYAFANARGMMDDNMHLSHGGKLLRNHALWQNQLIGSFPLGAAGGVAPTSPLFRSSSASGTVNGNTTYSDRSLGIRPSPGNAGYLEWWDYTQLYDFRYAWLSYAASGSLWIKTQNFDVAQFSFRFFKPLYGVAFRKTTQTASFSHWHWEHTAMCDATAGPITATLAHLTTNADSSDGRIHTFKKIDPSTNVVSVVPAPNTFQRGSGVTTLGSANITFASNGSVPVVGQVVTGTGIPADAAVVSATLTSATLNKVATASGSGLTFSFLEGIDGKGSFPLANLDDFVTIMGSAGVWKVIATNVVDKTVIAAGTTGNQTINTPSGRVNFAAGATSLVVTCSRCNTNSVVVGTIATNDATADKLKIVPSNGSFTIHLGTAPTGETAVNWRID